MITKIMNKTMFSKFHIRTVGAIVALAAIIAIGVVIAFVAIISIGGVAYSSHSWGNYHWARTANPVTVKLGDNVGTAWDSYLTTASRDWSVSSVLDTLIVPGKTNPNNCRAVSGRVEVCNSKYGNNGWLGIASIWVSGSHITQGTVKLNDSYLSTAKYNTPVWKNFIMCQEIGHTLGLDHQDVNFSNSNLGTCMDYTNNPSGPPSNERPNAHDYEQLVTIYGHLDSITTVGQLALPGRGQYANGADIGERGMSTQKDSRGRTSRYGRDIGNGEKLFTFVIWVE